MVVPSCCRRHKFFNTNNLWVNLDKLQSTLDEQGGLLKLPLIKNKKTVRADRHCFYFFLHFVHCWRTLCRSADVSPVACIGGVPYPASSRASLTPGV